MGGKGSPQAPPPVQDNSAEMMTALQGMMGAMMSSMNSMNEAYMNRPPPQMPAMPTIPSFPNIDWEERNKQLSEKAKADYKNEQARKFGRMDTILTSPLLDDEEPNTIKSLLSGA